MASSPTQSSSSTLMGRKNPSSFLSLRFIATTGKKAVIPKDEILKKVLKSEIECQENHQRDLDRVLEIPEGFPFEIVDTPGDQTIILKRDFAGENIRVTVLMNDEDEQNDDDSGSCDEDTHQPSFSLVVNVDKGVGNNVEFCCNLTAGELSIESMEMKKSGENDNEEAYYGPEFADLDESLKKALRNYLKERGIKRSLFDFLHEYMLHKDDREYLMWLKNIKIFVEG